MNTPTPCSEPGGLLPPGYVAPAIPLRPQWTPEKERTYRSASRMSIEHNAARVKAMTVLHNALFAEGLRPLSGYARLLAENAEVLRDLLAPFDPRHPDEFREVGE